MLIFDRKFEDIQTGVWNDWKTFSSHMTNARAGRQIVRKLFMVSENLAQSGTQSTAALVMSQL